MARTRNQVIQQGIPDPFWNPASPKENQSAMRDGFIGLSGGMNAGIDPLSLQESQCARAVNVTFRGNMPATRPVFLQHGSLQFAGERCYGSIVWSLQGGDSIVSVIDGKVIVFDLDGDVVFNYTEMFDLPLFTCPHGKVWMVQAEHFVIIQDGLAVPIILSPGDARQADQTESGTDDGITGYEVPIGTIMAYGHGRLFLVPKSVGDEDGRRFILAGNIMWPTKPEKLLRFTEVQYLAGGGAMSLPTEMGIITGMGFTRTISGNGQGTLIVFARGGACQFAINAPRLTWQDIDISNVLFQTGGTVSPQGIVNVNSDLVFRGLDGIRSIGFSQAAAQVMSNVPISGAAGDLLDVDLEEDLAHTTGATANNYLAFTFRRNGNTWDALLVFDLAPISVLGQSSTPILAGIWSFPGLTGLYTARSAGAQVMIGVRVNGGLVAPYRLDYTASGVVTSRIYTGVQNAGATYYLKTLQELQFWVSDVRENSTLTVYYRPRGYDRWILAGTTTLLSFQGYGRYPMISIPIDKTSSGCDPITGESMTTADDFQFCIEWNGNLKLDKMMSICSLMTSGPRLADTMTTGGRTFPGVVMESTDFDLNTGR